MDWDINLRLRHVRAFLEIARAESVSAAAIRLNITQPAVSRSLKELEEMLGTSLFDRVGRGIRLNEAGRVFQAHASASMIELMRGHDRLSKILSVPKQLSIGALPTASTDLLPRAIMRFRREMPHVRLHIMTGPNWLLFNRLRDGAIDLVVGRMPEKEGLTGVVFLQLYIEDVVLVCRPGHPILQLDNPKDGLGRYDLILPPAGAVIASTVGRFLASVGFPEMRGAIETVALPVGRKIVTKSDAIWFISRGVVADELANGSLVAANLKSPLLSGPVGTSFVRSAPLNLERSTFIESLQQSVDLS